LNVEINRISFVPSQFSPTIGFGKCNLDAAICMTNNKIGVRACIRDEKGNFIAAMTSFKEGAMTTLEAKVWSLN
jgi:hypothetical protein